MNGYRDRKGGVKEKTKNVKWVEREKLRNLKRRGKKAEERERVSK